MKKLIEFSDKRTGSEGFVLPALISSMVALVIIILAVGTVIDANFSLVNTNNNSQKAFNIAEAGLNYYLWHLSHNPTDYKDGLTTPSTPNPTLGYGPYTHSYIDDNGISQGTYTLWIKPQGGGSSVVKVRSIAKTTGSNAIRTLEAQIGAPSFSSYAILANSALWFGNTETADGPIFSNQGIRMDGPNTDNVTSANSTYTPPSSLGGDGNSHPGVWCSLSVTSPVDCATRSTANWYYPAPLIDFNQISGTLCTIKKLAFAADSLTSALANLSNACSQTPTTRTSAYIPQRSSSANASRGYLIDLNSNGTYNLYTVNNENDTQSNYSSALFTPTLVQSNITPVSDGIIFVEDNVWVRTNPTFHGRLTIASGRLATSVSTNIKAADDIVYSTKNGDDALGLIAEGSVMIAPYAAPASGSFTLEIDAAVIAQTGNVWFPSRYSFASQICTKGYIDPGQQLSFYGSIAVRQIWTWSWLRGSACNNAVYDSSLGYYLSGFKYNITSYDYNLLYNPPPSFPITSSYNILSWREVVDRP